MLYLFPAYAGVILAQRLIVEYEPPFPRVCGGDPVAKIRAKVADYFSPRMRG